MPLRTRRVLRAILAVAGLLTLAAIPVAAVTPAPAVTVCESTLLVSIQSAATTGAGAGAGATTDKFVLATGRYAYTVGTGSGQVSKQYNTQFVLASAGTTNYDLSGALTNRAGDTAVFTQVRIFYVKNTSATSNVTVGGGSNAAPVPVVTLPPGGEILVRAPASTPWAITAGTADILKVTSDASNATADIGVAGI